MKIQFTLNDKPVTIECDAERKFVDVLREDFHLTGTKEGCGEGECGACTILLDDQAVHACLLMAAQVDGHQVTTIEGLAKDGELDILQQAFIDNFAIQCGYCTAGMILSAKGLLLHNPLPTEEEIRVAISGNICRCSGYTQIIAAIKDASLRLAGKTQSKEG